MPDLVLRDVVVDGMLVDVRASGGVIVEIDRRLPRAPATSTSTVVAGRVIPGLHDHHIHLMALAAADRSPFVGPPYVADVDAVHRRPRPGPRRAGPRRVAARRSATTSRSPGRSTAGGSTPSWPSARSASSTAPAARGSSTRSPSSVTGIDAHGDGSTTPASSATPTAVPPAACSGSTAGCATASRSAPPDLGRRRAPARRATASPGVTDPTPVDPLGDLEPVAAAAADGSLPQHVTVTGGPRVADGPCPARSRRAR